MSIYPSVCLSPEGEEEKKKEKEEEREEKTTREPGSYKHTHFLT